MKISSTLHLYKQLQYFYEYYEAKIGKTWKKHKIKCTINRKKLSKGESHQYLEGLTHTLILLFCQPSVGK